MLCQFPVYSKVIWLYIYMYLFYFKLFFHLNTEYWAAVTVLYSRSRLIIYFKYSSMYMSIPNSRSIPHPPSSSSPKFMELLYFFFKWKFDRTYWIWYSCSYLETYSIISDEIFVVWNTEVNSLLHPSIKIKILWLKEIPIWWPLR